MAGGGPPPESAPSLVDIHCHLLPGVDDGAEDIDMSLALIDQGLADGIGAWVLTPHVLGPIDGRIDEVHRGIFDDLRDEVARRGLPAELYLASELMFQTDVEAVRACPSGTFNANGRYFLMEFPMDILPLHAEEVLFDYQMGGMRPIIAHPERNASLAADPRIIARMVDRGILMQVNAGSLAQHAPDRLRRLTEALIAAGEVHFVASDAHHPMWRPASLRPAYDRIAETTGEEVARRLCIENPRRAIEGHRIATERPELPQRVSWWRRRLERWNLFR